ncbi:MAG: 5-formyltetrahydrofolate cyclo-ligase, partial [Candidatus Gracilibacteria bacterium]|nr:5-formyltetrahydrofolate cyclo-ligase [Candidatus Gracilibacteria bacterium]
ILENAFEGKIDISVVPGLAFTKEGTRLGRGGGFYDRFFAKNKDGFKIGLCYDSQLIAKIDEENHDVKMDLVITN